MAAAKNSVIQIKILEETLVSLEIEGITPVIPHRWSEKSRRQLPGHPERDTMSKKGMRDPVAEAEACLYRLNDGRLGLPATAFKSAMVAACRFFEKPTMKAAKLMFFVRGEGAEQLVPITGELELHEDIARNANFSVDLRYRYYIYPWRTEITVEFVKDSISAESIAALLDAAGRVGVGDWRPGSPKSDTGTYGQFRLVRN